MGKQRAKGMGVIGRQCNNLTFYAKEHGISISRIYLCEIHPTLGEYMNPKEFTFKTLSSSHILTGGTPKLPTLNIWAGIVLNRTRFLFTALYGKNIDFEVSGYFLTSPFLDDISNF